MCPHLILDLQDGNLLALLLDGQGREMVCQHRVFGWRFRQLPAKLDIELNRLEDLLGKELQSLCVEGLSASDQAVALATHLGWLTCWDDNHRQGEIIPADPIEALSRVVKDLSPDQIMSRSCLHKLVLLLSPLLETLEEQGIKPEWCRTVAILDESATRLAQATLGEALAKLGLTNTWFLNRSLAMACHCIVGQGHDQVGVCMLGEEGLVLSRVSCLAEQDLRAYTASEALWSDALSQQALRKALTADLQPQVASLPRNLPSGLAIKSRLDLLEGQPAPLFAATEAQLKSIDASRVAQLLKSNQGAVGELKRRVAQELRELAVAMELEHEPLLVQGSLFGCAFLGHLGLEPWQRQSFRLQRFLPRERAARGAAALVRWLQEQTSRRAELNLRASLWLEASPQGPHLLAHHRHLPGQDEPAASFKRIMQVSESPVPARNMDLELSWGGSAHPALSSLVGQHSLPGSVFRGGGPLELSIRLARRAGGQGYQGELTVGHGQEGDRATQTLSLRLPLHQTVWEIEPDDS